MRFKLGNRLAQHFLRCKSGLLRVARTDIGDATLGVGNQGGNRALFNSTPELLQFIKERVCNVHGKFYGRTPMWLRCGSFILWLADQFCINPVD